MEEDQHQRGTETSRLHAANSNTAATCSRVTSNLLDDFVDSHAVFEVLKHDRNRRTSIFEHPCPAYFTGDTFHATLRPVESADKSSPWTKDTPQRRSFPAPGANWNRNTAKENLNIESPFSVTRIH
jgi:hypothetical protein